MSDVFFKEWLTRATRLATPNSYADDAMIMLKLLYEQVEQTANCPTCRDCTMHAELALQAIEDHLGGAEEDVDEDF